MVTEKDVRRALRTVKDPELNLDLVVLGLIYDIEIQDTHVKATISLTSPFCPVAGQIIDDARAAIEGVEGVESADVELTFSPPWTPERIDPIIRSSPGFCAMQARLDGGRLSWSGAGGPSEDVLLMVHGFP